MFAVSEQLTRPDIVGQNGKQQGILAIVLEHHQALHQVCPKQREVMNKFHTISQKMYEEAQKAEAQQDAPQQEQPQDDNVVDADYEEVDKK